MITTFLSSPYSHPDARVQHARYIAAGDFAAWLLRERRVASWSPIVHWFDIAGRHDLPHNALAWVDVNTSYLLRCDCMHVLCLPGWRNSQGIAMELHWAQQADKPIYYAVKSTEGYLITNEQPWSAQ